MALPSKPLHYLITGAGRGIGRGLVRNALQEGHRVFLIDSNEDELNNTLKLAETSWVIRTNCLHKDCVNSALVDLSDRVGIEKAVQEVSKFFKGRLDVLINNAMATPHTWTNSKTMEDDVMAEWDTKIAIGLTAPFLLSRLCIHMLKSTRPGCIINISSTRATQAEDNHEGYSAVKAGVLGLTQSMAVSLGHTHGIRVNAIVPGWIHAGDECLDADEKGTRWHEGLSREDHKWHPAGRVGRVDDITKAVKYLIESDFVSGEEMVISGGVERKMVYPE